MEGAYLVRLKPDAAPPPDAASIIGKWHIQSVGPLGRYRYAFRGHPTRCGRELEAVAYVSGAPPNVRFAHLWMTTSLAVYRGDETRLCKTCFGRSSG